MVYRLSNRCPTASRHISNEMIRSTAGGILVEPESAEAVAAGIIELLNNAEQREHLGETGKMNVHQKFNDATIAAQLLKVFEKYI